MPIHPDLDDDTPAIAQRNRSIARRMLAAFNTGQTQVVDEVISPNIIQHSAHPIPPNGNPREALKEEILLPRKAFPDQHFEEEHLIVEGDMVFMGWHMTGTNTGTLYGKQGTGARFSLNGGDAFRIKEGLIVEHWDQFTKPRWESLIKMGLLDEQMQAMLLRAGLI